ncbi:MAG: hypothetical protein HY659_01160 [Rhizobiales bacterium]|nr:hypothetical protein [Hyphomicrobiales bacterium]
MRMFLGIILGAVLTVALAYAYDLRAVSSTTGSTANEQRTMVNWDVVESNWREIKARARESWARLAG